MKRTLLSLLSAMLVICSCSMSGRDDAIVRISSGRIHGEFTEGIYSFKGVPYATAGRFQPSRYVDSWKGVRECTEYGPWAKQPGNGESVEGEGDFIANVWTSLSRSTILTTKYR